MSEEEKKITGEIDISKTIESNIDYWRNKCFEQQKEIEELKEIIKVCDQDLELLNGFLVKEKQKNEKILGEK